MSDLPTPPPGPNLYFDVDYFQINAGVDAKGDAAIALLVLKETGKKKKPVASVVSAIMIDGGEGKGTAGLMLSTVNRIQAEYSAWDWAKRKPVAYDVNKGRFLKFDAVIISHWDTDHYRGFLYFLANSASWDSPPTRFNHFKYTTKDDEDDEGKPIKVQVPLTGLYSQSNRWPKVTKGKGFGIATACFLRMPRDTSDVFEWGVTFVKNRKTTMVDHVLAGYATTDLLIGTNLFTGRSLTHDKTWPEVKSLADLVTYNNPSQSTASAGGDDWAGAPGWYIVGVNSTMIGNTPVLASAPPSSGLGVIDLVDPSQTNPNSVVCLLVWKNRGLKAASPKVSLYSGGDAEYPMENSVATFVNKEPIQVVKMGHHGSDSGTSMKFIDAVRPKHVLVSAGTQHGHPVPEVILYLDAWFSVNPDPLISKPLHGVTYPYYLAFVDAEPSDGKSGPPVRRYYQNKITDPDRLTTLYLAKDGTAKRDIQLYINFVKYLQATYASTKSTDRIEQFTDRVQAVIDSYTTKPTGKKALTEFATKKTACLSPILTSAWTQWSDTVYQNISPKVKNDRFRPPTMVVLDYIRCVFHYNYAQWKEINALETTVQLMKDGQQSVITPSKKKAKYTVNSTVRATGGQPGQLGAGKRRREEESRVPVTDALFALSDAEEQKLWITENGGALFVIEPDEFDISTNVFRGHLPPDSQLRAPSAASVAPTMIRCSDGPAGDSVIVLKDASDSDYFVAALEGGSMSLSSATLQDSLWTAVLDPADPLQLWLEDLFVNPIGSVVVNLSGITTSDPYMQKIDLVVTVAAKTRLHYTTDQATITTAFNVSTADSTAILDDHGFFKTYTGLVLGLQVDLEANSLALTVRDVFSLAEVDIPPFLDSQSSLSLKGGGGSSNGLWICPDQNMSVTYRLTLQGDSSTAFLSPALPGLAVKDCAIILTRRACQQMDIDGVNMVSTGELCIAAQTQLSGTSNVWDTYITVNPTSLQLILRWADSGDPVSQFLTWLSTSLKLDIGPAYSDFGAILSQLDLHLREISITAENDDDGWRFYAFIMTFELDLTWGVDDPNANPAKRVPVKLRFSYLDGTTPFVEFSGSLWRPSLGATYRLTPDSMPYPYLESALASPQYHISLLSLGGWSDEQKAGFPSRVIPTYVTGLNITLNTDSLAFSGTMVHDPDAAPDPNPPWLALNSIEISARYTRDLGALFFDFAAEIDMRPRGDLLGPMMALDVNVEYDSDVGWTFEGTVVDLNVGCLYHMFPDTDNDAVANLMADMNVSLLNVTYDHRSSTTSFAASGALQIGDVELDLTFNRQSGLSATADWEFQATLTDGFQTTGSTMGSLLAGVSSDLAAILPDFISQAGFTVATTTAPSSIVLECKKVSSEYMLLSLVASVDAFNFSLVQLTTSSPSPSGYDGSKAQRPKRLIKLTLDKLPDVKDVPLLDHFIQPFDSVDFIWASDDFTTGELTEINDAVYPGVKDKIVFSDPATLTSDPTRADKALIAGCHFIVVVEQNHVPSLVMDHVFGASPPAPRSVHEVDNGTVPPSGGIMRSGPIVPRLQSTYPTDTGSSIAPWCTTLGPLTISAIGLKYDQGSLQINFDASIQLGPVSGFVKGFGLKFAVKDLHSIGDVTVLFDGIGLGLDRPPVSLDGLLLRLGPDQYAGGVAIRVDPYTFLAGGFYGLVSKDARDPSKGTFKSAFVFAELGGPLIELEFASVSGLEGGFGYNSLISLPTVDHVTTFPFLAAAPSGDLLTVLQHYLTSGTFTPADGPAWLTAGLTVTAFQTLQIKAVIAVDLAADVTFGLYADVLANVPSHVTDDAELFARLDMGFVATLEPAKGTFRAEGQLMPTSFVLSQDCHLSGGFALCYWYAGSGHEGDWVYTVGGYHSAYTPPTWYPRPPRLAISWQYDSTISIHGDAYFAITPKCCMGGGSLLVNYQSGSLSAYFNAYADFLINYRPFSFVARVGVDMGVAYTLDLWFVTKHFDIHIGASVDLHGPPVAGVAHIDWCIISFDIHFGQTNPPMSPLGWSEFQAMLRQDDPNKPPTDENSLTGRHMHVMTATSGVMQDGGSRGAAVKTAGTETLLVDQTTFGFRFATLFPIATFIYAAGTPAPGGDAPTSNPTFARPMHVTSATTITSTVSLVVQDQQGHDAKFSYESIVKDVPTAIWSAYSADSDPSDGRTVASLLDSKNATIAQNMGIQLVAPVPTDSDDAIFFNVDLASSSALFPPGSSPVLPGPMDVPTDGMDANHFDDLVNKMYPIVSAVPYSTRNITARMARPTFASHALITSWMAYTGTTTESTFGAALAQLGTSTTTAPAWTSELYTKPNEPLPILSAQASVKALINDGTRFATWDPAEAAPSLNRAFYDGGETGYPWN